MDVEGLLKATMDEVEKLLSTKTVVGEPMTMDGFTVVPLISTYFGFGIGGGGGAKAEKEKGEGRGLGSGLAAGIRPVAIIIGSSEGVKLEPIKSGAASVADRVTEVVGRMLEKRAQKKEQGSQ